MWDVEVWGVVIYQRVIYNSDQALSFVLLYVSTSRPDNLLQINVVSRPQNDATWLP